MVRPAHPVPLTVATSIELTHTTATAALAPRLTAVEAVMRFIQKKPLGAAGAFIILGMLAVAASAELIAPYDAYTADYSAQFARPSAEHWFGTDEFGRDLMSRIMYGARIALFVGFTASFLGCTIGGLLGVTSAYLGGKVDLLLERLMDMLLAFPQLLFIISLISVVPNQMFGLTGTGVRLTVMILVIGFFGWPYIGRIVRGQTLSLREREYVEAARSLGAGRRYILFKELLPNLIAPITVYTTLMIPTNILTEAALSFLGVGVKPPTASWGQMLSQAVRYYEADPMFMVVPGVAIFITVLSFNLFGDGVRDALDPKGTR